MSFQHIHWSKLGLYLLIWWARGWGELHLNLLSAHHPVYLCKSMSHHWHVFLVCWDVTNLIRSNAFCLAFREKLTAPHPLFIQKQSKVGLPLFPIQRKGDHRWHYSCSDKGKRTIQSGWAKGFKRHSLSNIVGRESPGLGGWGWVGYRVMDRLKDISDLWPREKLRARYFGCLGMELC